MDALRGSRIAAICLVAVVGASVVLTADMAGGLTCADRFPEDLRLGPWGRGESPGQILEQARAFRGDRHLGPLRWARAHETVVDAPTFGEAVEQALADVPGLVPGPDIPFNRDWDLTVADGLLLFQHRNLTLAFPLSRGPHR
jgi:hypothetical protein